MVPRNSYMWCVLVRPPGVATANRIDSSGARQAGAPQEAFTASQPVDRQDLTGFDIRCV